MRITKQQFEILYNIKRNKPILSNTDNARVLDVLQNSSLIDKDNRLTQKGEEILEEFKIENAVILAAGMSTRFVPLCFDVPKGLLTVRGEVLIERQIRQLREVGINDISIVVGFKKEMFEYLQEKFGVKLIFNPDYAIKNNFASVYVAKYELKNSIITSSDLFFSENIFESYAYDAFYCSIYQKGKTPERGLMVDSEGKIIATSYNSHDCWVSLGYAYYSRRFSENYINIVSKIINNPEYTNKFWADIQDEHLEELFMYIKKVGESTIYEFDTLAELRDFDSSFSSLKQSKTMSLLCEYFKASENDFTDFVPVDMTNRVKISSFKFRGDEYQYIIDTEKNTFEVVSLKNDNDLNSSGEKFNRHKKISEIKELINSFNEDQEVTLPLCAAENVMSEFCKIPLNSNFQERYIMGSSNNYKVDDNFIGSEYLLPFYNKIADECKSLYKCEYSDARTLSGMNCLTMLVMSLTKMGDNIMILDKKFGGHASVAPILERLGLNVFYAPYNIEKYDFDYDKLNIEIKKNNIKYFLAAPSDILYPFDISKIDDSNCVILYDVSQTLGLIAAGLWENPLEKMKNIVMFGGTHKTIPGPAHGLILTNNKELYDIFDYGINPKYLRNTQMHQVISLLFTLIEMEYYGTPYQSNTVRMGNILGKYLEEEGLSVVKRNGVYTTTHQLFIECSESRMNTLFNHAVTERITLNTKKKPLFRTGYGIRLGLQEISRYAWDDESLKTIARIIKIISEDYYKSSELHGLLQTLPPKKIHYTFENAEIKDLIKACNVFSHYKIQ